MSEPVLDATVLDTLRQLTPPGEPDVLAEVLELFLQEAPRRIEKLIAAWAANDAAELYKTAHSLKGSAGNIGAQPLFRVCSQLDGKGRAGDLTHVKPLVETLAAEYARVEAAIRLILKG